VKEKGRLERGGTGGTLGLGDVALRQQKVPHHISQEEREKKECRVAGLQKEEGKRGEKGGGKGPFLSPHYSEEGGGGKEEDFCITSTFRRRRLKGGKGIHLRRGNALEEKKGLLPQKEKGGGGKESLTLERKKKGGGRGVERGKTFVDYDHGGGEEVREVLFLRGRGKGKEGE